MSKRIRTHTNPLSFHQKMAPIDFKEVFPEFDGCLDFEIGFGKGIFLTQYASRYPNRYILGIEVRKQAVDYVQSRLDSKGISNVVICHGAANRCLLDIVPDASIARCFIFHPDPWLKDRHAKRRVIQPELLALFGKKLRPKGRVYVSTDVGFLWDDIHATFKRDLQFEAIENDEFWSSDYETHWSMFSDIDERDSFFGTFQKI